MALKFNNHSTFTNVNGEIMKDDQGRTLVFKLDQVTSFAVYMGNETILQLPFGHWKKAKFVDNKMTLYEDSLGNIWTPEMGDFPYQFRGLVAETKQLIILNREKQNEILSTMTKAIEKLGFNELNPEAQETIGMAFNQLIKIYEEQTAQFKSDYNKEFNQGEGPIGNNGNAHPVGLENAIEAVEADIEAVGDELDQLIAEIDVTEVEVDAQNAGIIDIGNLRGSKMPASITKAITEREVRKNEKTLKEMLEKKQA